MTLEELRAKFSYDPETGIISRLYAGTTTARLGPCEFKKRYGYLDVVVGKQTYAAHRLAWLLHYGTDPVEQIDHINCIKTDNRIANLREATRSQNCANVPVGPNNKLGIKGVYLKKDTGKYIAKIRKGGKQVWLGSFNTAAEAGEAYRIAALETHGEFARFK